MASIDRDDLQVLLKRKRICRFCLCKSNSKLKNIYKRDTGIKSSAPLPMQIMAVASIEVFKNDDMPSYLCFDCAKIFEFGYQFKQMCKKADNLLRQFPLTGQWPARLDRPVLLTNQFPKETLATPEQCTNTTKVRIQYITNNSVQDEPLQFPNNTRNSPSKSSDAIITSDISSVENDCVEMDNVPVAIVPEDQTNKLLNNSSIRILTKKAEQENEPILSLPKANKDADGKKEIVADLQRHSLIHYSEKLLSKKVLSPSASSSDTIISSDISSQSERDADELTFLDKIGNNELSLNDTRVERDNIPVVIVLENETYKPNSLNNKEAGPENEPGLSLLKVNKYVDTRTERAADFQRGEKRYKCSICDQAFSRSTMLTHHEKIHTDVPKYICVHCERSFILKEDMEAHIERHIINQPFACKICNKRFVSKQSLEGHEVIHKDETDPNNTDITETNIYPCSFCERSFSLLQLRDIHMKTHFRDRKFQCKKCEKKFLSKHEMIRHSNRHSGRKPYKCSACDQSFSRPMILKRHEMTHTNLTKYICSLCERSFLLKEEMEKHLESHKINRPFACKICNKRFSVRQSLHRHMRVHYRQHPYTCQYCEESFPTTTKLYRHLSTHAGVRPYACKYCKKSYLLSSQLTRHLRSHKNVDDPGNTASFMCIRCNCNFGTRDELIIHSTTHANEMNLTCSLCKDVFDNISDLKSHIQDHSQREEYACEFCDLIFLTAEKLQSHTGPEHINEMEAYHTDDNAQANKLIEDDKSQINIIDIEDAKLQEPVHELIDEKDIKVENDDEQGFQELTQNSQLCPESNVKHIDCNQMAANQQEVLRQHEDNASTQNNCGNIEMEEVIYANNDNANTSCDNRTSGSQININSKAICDLFYNFEIPWVKLSSEITKRLNEKEMLGKLLKAFANTVVDELREISHYIPMSVYRGIAEKASSKFPDSFIERDGEGNIMSHSPISLIATMRNRNNFLNNGPRKKSVDSDKPHKKRSLNALARTCVNLQPLNTMKDHQDVNTKKKFLWSMRHKDKLSADEEEIVKKYMTDCFSSQRVFFNNSQPPPTVKEILSHWPMIFRKDCLYSHFSTVMELDVDIFKKNFYASSDKMKSFFGFQHYPEEKSILKAICNFFKEKDTLIFKEYKFGTTLDEVKEDAQVLTPWISIFETSIEEGCTPTAYIWLEKEITSKEENFNFLDLVLQLLCYYYIFNLVYPKNISQTFEFLMRYFFRFYPSQMRGKKLHINNLRKINTLISKLDAIA